MLHVFRPFEAAALRPAFAQSAVQYIRARFGNSQTQNKSFLTRCKSTQNRFESARTGFNTAFDNRENTRGIKGPWPEMSAKKQMI
jgi:hypothetical protein